MNPLITACCTHVIVLKPTQKGGSAVASKHTRQSYKYTYLKGRKICYTYTYHTPTHLHTNSDTFNHALNHAAKMKAKCADKSSSYQTMVS